MPAYTEVFGGTVIYPSDTTFLGLTPTEDVELSWPIEQQVGGFVVADIIEVNTSTPGISISIPSATQASTGFASLINNIGVETVTVLDADGNTICSVASGEAWEIYLADNTTVAGTWRVFQYGAGVSNANAAALAGAGIKAIGTTLNQKVDVSVKTVDYELVNADRAKAVQWRGGVGTFTLPDATEVGADWWVIISNQGEGAVLLQPQGGQTIDTYTSFSLEPRESCILGTDGANFTFILFAQVPNSIFNYTSIDVAGSGDYILPGTELDRISYNLTGALTGNRTIRVPAGVQEYWVQNNTTGNFTLTVATLAGTGIEVPQGTSTILFSNGMDIVNAVRIAPVTTFGNKVSAVPGVTENNYNPGTWSGGRFKSSLRLTPPGGGSTLTGIDTTNMTDGQTFELMNMSDTDSITLANESGASSANNRFHLPFTSDMPIIPGQVILVTFETDTNRLRVVS